MGILSNVRRSIHDITTDAAELNLGDPAADVTPESTCRPVLVERRNRKAMDELIIRRLSVSIRQGQVTMWGVVTMVAFAAMEYFGILGNGESPTWVNAVFRGLTFMAGSK
jgi:hypothetical protein